MRFIILGLAIIFFTLSAFITFKALGLPVHETSSQNIPIEPPSESNKVVNKSTEEAATDKAVVADLEAKIAQLEDKLKTKEQALESIKTPDAEKGPQTLAVFGGGTFHPGQVAIADAAFATINNIVGTIAASPGRRVVIEGHTDNIPTGKLHDDNMDLSLRRARVIANSVVAHGISPDRISVIGYGDARPIDSNDTAEGRAKNRRVEVILMPKKGEN